MTILVGSLVALFVAHLFATLLGAGSITVAQWQYFRAIRDGRIDDGERAHLVALFFSLRFALVVLLLVEIVLGIVLYAVHSVVVPALTASYWFGMIIIVSLIVTSWMRFHARIPFWLGSGISFVGWWYLVGMDVGFVPVTGVPSALVGFVASVLVIAALFEYAGFLIRDIKRD